MNILGPPRKPLVKILKVEDLKNDDIVARIKKELASNLTFGKTDSIVTPQVSKNTLNVISETIFIKHPQIKQEELVSEAPVDGTDADNEDTNADNESQAEVVEQQAPAEMGDVIIDCDATITQEDISELGTDSRIIIVQDKGGRGVYSRKRREKFLKMTLADLPAKKEKIEKCYRYLLELLQFIFFIDACKSIIKY